MEEPYTRIYAEINLDHVVKNMKAMAANLPKGIKIIGVVKTDGYGHGAVPIAKAIHPFVWGYATATLEEAIILRQHGIVKPILVLGSVSEKYFEELIKYDIRPSIFEYSKAECLSSLAVEQGRKAAIHIALDTGMSRIGYAPCENSLTEIEAIEKLPGIVIEGLFTHFSRADETDPTTTQNEYKSYKQFAEALEKRGVKIPIKHCSNSAAMIDYHEMSLDAVRAGIAMYGLYPSDQVDKKKVTLCPAMELYSFISYIKEIEAGTPVSYGGTFVAEHKMRIATVGVGYGDGYPRNLSGKGAVLIAGKRAPILGRVCMDQLMVDVTDVKEAKAEDRVTLIGHDGNEFISIEELANTGGGFHYEIPCVLGKRVPRVYVSGGKIVGKKDYNNDRYEDFM
ncbi:MAG: alanine racemase [Clostridium sp.]